MNRLYYQPICFLALACLLCACGTSEKPNQPFAFNPSPDSVYHFNIATVESTEGPGSSDTIRQTIRFTLQPIQQEDSLHIMKLVFKQISITEPQMAISTNNGEMKVIKTGAQITLSTEDIINDADYSVLEKAWLNVLPHVIGDSMEIVINNRGEVQQVSGYEKIAEKITAATGIDRFKVNQSLRKHIATETISDLINELFFYLPGNNIQKGDTWVKNMFRTAKAPVKFSNLIAVSDIKDDEVQLSVQAEVSARAGEGGKKYQEGNLTGTITASLHSGILLTGNFTDINTTHTDHYDVVRKRTLVATRN